MEHRDALVEESSGDIRKIRQIDGGLEATGDDDEDCRQLDQCCFGRQGRGWCWAMGDGEWKV